MAHGSTTRLRAQHPAQQDPRNRYETEATWEEVQDEAQDENFDTALHLASHAQRIKNIETSALRFENAVRALRSEQAHDRQRQNMLMGILAGGFILSILVTAFMRPAASPAPVARVAPQPAVAQQQQIMPPSVAQGLAMANAQIQSGAQPALPYPQNQNNSAAQTLLPAPIVNAPAYIPPAPAQNPQQQNYIQSALQAPPAPLTQIRPAPVQQPLAPQPSATSAVAAVQALGARYDQQVQKPLSPFQQKIKTRLAAKGEVIPADWQPLFDREAKGDRKGRLLVAAKLLKGEGVTRDQTLAIEVIRGAADEGEKEAMMWLAYANQGGNLGKVDMVSAVRWFEAAGRAGVAQAYTELGRIYEAGIDGAPDVETAIAWYQRARDAGDPKAAEALARLQQPISQNMPAAGTPLAVTGDDPRARDVQKLVQDQAPVDGAQGNNDVFVPAPPATAYTPVGAPMAARPVAASMPMPSSQTGMDPREAAGDVRAVQRMLKALGYKIDRVDGEFGPQTANAIRLYQRDRALYPDGEPSAQLIEVLSRDIRYSE